TKLSQGTRSTPSDELPRTGGTTGKRIDRGRNAESSGLGDWLSQKVNERLMDAPVCDATRSEKKFHAASRAVGQDLGRGEMPRATKRLADRRELIASGGSRGTQTLKVFRFHDRRRGAQVEKPAKIAGLPQEVRR